VLLACVEIAECVQSTNKRDNDAWRMDRKQWSRLMREIKNSFFYNERKRKIGGRLCFVKDKRMHMPKMPKQNNLVKPQKRLGGKNRRLARRCRDKST
jgi:hypothetical protein